MTKRPRTSGAIPLHKGCIHGVHVSTFQEAILLAFHGEILRNFLATAQHSILHYLALSFSYTFIYLHSRLFCLDLAFIHAAQPWWLRAQVQPFLNWTRLSFTLSRSFRLTSTTLFDVAETIF